MVITRDTKLADLLKEYPWLKDEAMKVSDKFKILNTPVGKIMLKKATVAEMSKRSGISEDKIIEKLTNMIKER
ncbi:MAG: DUF1858 domain-containing protein [Firmicutes bacterium]|nr:DUF1858 domain-containing protein [Bacillota bacterium]